MGKKSWKGSGILIPSKSGHNGDLTDDELRYLKELIIIYGSDESESEDMGGKSIQKGENITKYE